jgi:primosomal protein N' (replication factor Y)
VTADDRQLARDPGAVAARLPSLAWQAARDSLHNGLPVLVQVPRRGYVPSVACQDCRERARCPNCSGPLALSNHTTAVCRWCARPAADYTCPRCGSHRLRAAITGVRRTAEEMGRALPDTPVRTSGGDTVMASIPPEPALVLATPGAEPFVEGGGYGAVLLLDTWALLTRADLRASEEALRRWMTAAALAVPAGRGGTVVVVADGSLTPVQALLRWDAAWLAARELADRRALGFPPAARMASLQGSPLALMEFLAAVELPEGAQELGPLEIGDGQERMLLRVKRSEAPGLAHALHAAAGARSAKKAAEPVRIQLDPLELL